jgi:O-antigen ligase
VSRSGHLDELRSFTGRTDIWAATWRLIEQAPWLGHGFASSREVLPAHFTGAYGWTTTSAHNLWLQGWLTTGALGLALVLAAQAAWLRQAVRQPCAPREAVVVFVLVVGLLEAGALGPSVNLVSFVWLWAMALGAASASAPTLRGPAAGANR